MPTERATLLEAAVVLVALAGLVLAAWATLDDWIDRRAVKRLGEVGGPRWINANAHLRADALLLAAWCACLPLALVAAYLPPHPAVQQHHAWGVSVGDGPAALRLTVALGVFGAQLAWRVGRRDLRRLPPTAWDALFGEAGRWKRRYQEAEIENARLRADEHEVRARAHHWRNVATAADLERGLLQRWARRQGLVLPEFQALRALDEDEEGAGG